MTLILKTLQALTKYGPRKKADKMLKTPLKIYIDGPFGSPSSNIYRAEHAVLVGIGIAVTPLCFDPRVDAAAVPADEERLPRLQPHLEQRDGASDVQPEEGRLCLDQP